MMRPLELMHSRSGPAARRVPQVALALALVVPLVALVACTGPATRPDGGLDGPTPSAPLSVCGPARALLAESQWEEALIELRVWEATDPQAAASPWHDVCVARAFIGAGRPGEAAELLGGRVASATAPAQRSACLYAAWAGFAARGEPAGAAGPLAACDPSAALVGPSDALLASDAHGAALVVAAGRAQRNLASAVPVAEGLLQEPGASAATRRWLLAHLLEQAAGLPEAELGRLRQASDTLGPALAGWVELTRALEAGDGDAARALLPDVRARLLALGAETEARALDGRSVVDERARAPLFGAVVALSGPGRQLGRAQLAGLLLAEAVFEPSPPGGEPSRLLIADAGDSRASAAAAVARLDEAGVLAIIGPFDDAQAEAAMAEAESRGIPFISLADGVVPPAGARWSVRLFPSARAEADALIDVLARQGQWRVAVAVPDPTPPYLRALTERFQQRAAEAGIRVTTVEHYLVSSLQSEAARVARTLARDDFEALLIADEGGNATTLAAYLGTHDVWARAPGRVESGRRRFVTFLGTSFWHDPSYLREGPDYLEGGLFPAWLPIELGYEATLRFFDGFMRVYGRRPGLLGAYSHDALQLLRYLVLEGGVRTRPALAEAILRAELVGAATGELRFDASRVSATTPFVLRVTSDGFEPAAP
jgi:hypothetical protein